LKLERKVLFPHIIIIFLIAGLLLAFAFNRPDFAIRALVIVVPGILSSYLLLKIYNHNIEINKSVNMKPLFNSKISILLYILLYIISIIILLTIPYRPWYYFVIISILNIIIFIQIMSKRINPAGIIFEIVLVSVNMIYGVTLKYPLFFGGTDIFNHLFYAKVIFLSGHIIPRDLDPVYADFPLFHILIAEGTNIIGLEIKNTFFIITAISFIITIPLIYYISNHIIKDTQISLSACILYSSSSEAVYYGQYMVSRVMAFIGFILLVYLIFKKYNPIIFKILSQLVIVFLILVHQVSNFQFIAVLFTIYVLEWIINDEKKIKLNSILLYLVSFLAYLFFIAYNFTEIVISTRTKSTDFEKIIIKESIRPENVWIFLETHIHVSIFLFFALIGIGYFLWKGKPKYALVYILFALVNLIVYIPNPLQTLWQTMTLFRFDRFALIVSPFMALAMGCGVYVFYNYLQKINISRNISLLLLCFLIGGYSFTSIIDGENASDSYIWDNSSSREFNNVDLSTFNYIETFALNGSSIFSDYFVWRYFDAARNFSGSTNINIKYYDSRLISSPDSIPDYLGYIIYRKEELYKRNVLQFNSFEYNRYEENITEFERELDRLNKVYDNNFNQILLKEGG